MKIRVSLPKYKTVKFITFTPIEDQLLLSRQPWQKVQAIKTIYTLDSSLPMILLVLYLTSNNLLPSKTMVFLVKLIFINPAGFAIKLFRVTVFQMIKNHVSLVQLLVWLAIMLKTIPVWPNKLLVKKSVDILTQTLDNALETVQIQINFHNSQMESCIVSLFWTRQLKIIWE